MSNLPESPVWHEAINQIELDDDMTGGVDGNANLATRQLADRTQWLKAQAEALAKQLGVVLASQPMVAPPTGTWSFWYSTSTLNNLDTGEVTSTKIGKFTTQPIYDYINELRFKSDLPKKSRLPYEKFYATHSTATADGYSNRVLKYVAVRGEQPDYSTLPTTLDYQLNNGTSPVLDYTYYGVADDGSVWLSYGLGFPNPSAHTQAGLKHIIDAGQISPEQYYDVYYVFLLDEKADNLLTNEQITAQQWGKHHIEKVTMCTRWDIGTGGFTNVEISSQPMTEGGNIAAIEV